VEDHEIEDIQRKLKKRGFKTDGVRERCEGCSVNGVWIYKISSRTGGRDIKWCLACGTIRSWKRTSDDKLAEDTSFDLQKFLAQQT
jgi:hypothetical protein